MHVTCVYKSNVPKNKTTCYDKMIPLDAAVKYKVISFIFSVFACLSASPSVYPAVYLSASIWPVICLCTHLASVAFPSVSEAYTRTISQLSLEQRHSAEREIILG